MVIHKTKLSTEIEKYMLVNLITLNNKTENKHTYKERISICFCMHNINMPFPLLNIYPLPATIPHFFSLPFFFYIFFSNSYETASGRK